MSIGFRKGIILHLYQNALENLVIFLHYLMHFEVFLITFSSQIPSLRDIQCFL